MSGSKLTSSIADREVRACLEWIATEIDGVDAAWISQEYICECVIPAVLHGHTPDCQHPRCVKYYGACGALLEACAEHRSESSLQ